ncbi:MAG: Zn-ribbon domain-containing OB-fold protein [Dehalococcoidia bacterium]|nr:Zn-ribbon domain-containing OB-fold protein [Dehalococcoidia bacterium]
MTEATTQPAEATPYLKPLPEPTTASKPYWDAAREHRLLIQRSKKTGEYVFYPRIVSPFGIDDELEWVEVSGRGTVYTYTVAHRPTGPQWANDGPYVIAIIALEEGPRMTANVVECDPKDVHIGMPVVATYDDVTPEVTLVQFRPA